MFSLKLIAVVANKQRFRVNPVNNSYTKKSGPEIYVLPSEGFYGLGN